jgi:hypothetical protein
MTAVASGAIQTCTPLNRPQIEVLVKNTQPDRRKPTIALEELAVRLYILYEHREGVAHI